jgi:hypothetical protein
MPTQESWINDTTIFIEMTSPLTSSDISVCFKYLARLIADSPHPVDLLADVTQAGLIPVDAPMLAIQFGFLTDPHLKNVAVAGSSQWVQFLGRIATRRSNKPINFYATYEDAAAALGLSENARVE